MGNSLPAFEVFDVGSSRNAGGGGKFSKLPIEVNWPLAVFVIDDVRRIGGGGLFACIELRRSKLFRIVPVLIAGGKWFTIKKNFQKKNFINATSSILVLIFEFTSMK